MDTVRRFLTHVVPWGEGKCTLHWKRPKAAGFFGRACSTIDETVAAVKWALASRVGFDLYFCTSRNTGERKAENALAFASLFMDADVKEKGYKSLEEAHAAILDFCKRCGIPSPSIVVATGGGLHYYWLSNTTLSVKEWRPYAEGLKAAAQAAGLKIDFGVIADAARVLRVPDTFNWKTGKPRRVHLLEKCSSWKKYDFATDFTALLDVKPKLVKSQAAPAFAHLPHKRLGEGIKGPKIGLLPLEPILAGCAWLREVHETGGKDQSEPLWHQSLRCCAYLQDGETLIHTFSEGYDEYTHEKTEQKFMYVGRAKQEKDLGWPKCVTIEGEGCTHCKVCQYRDTTGTGRSPLHIGLGKVHEQEEKAEQEQIIEETGVKRTSWLPDGYVLNDSHICKINTGPKAKSRPVIPLLKTELSNPILVYKDGKLAICFTATTDLKNNKGVMNTQRVTFTGDDFASQNVGANLTKQNVIIETGKDIPLMVRDLGLSLLDKLRREQQATDYEGKFGWRYAHGNRVSFAYANCIYKIGGGVDVLDTGHRDEIRRWYQPVGTKEAWLKATKLLTDRKRPELDVILAIPFAAPLVVFCGSIYGAIISLWGEAGSGKSVAQLAAAAVWGHPKQTRESLDSTEKSVKVRMGTICNLPAYWDDVQTEEHLEKLFKSMFASTEGADHGKLGRDLLYQQRLEWQTIVIACSNQSFVEFLLRKQKSTTAGLRRVLEMNFRKRNSEPGMVDPHLASQIFGALEHNYGVMGDEYARYITERYEWVEQLVNKTVTEFRQSVNGTADENYWWGMCGVLLAGATFARLLGVNVSPVRMEHFLRGEYLKNREARREEGTEGGSYNNTWNALSDFLNHFTGADNVIYTLHLWKNLGDPEPGLLHEPAPRAPVYIHVIREERKILLSKKAFGDWMQKQDIRTKQVFEGLQKHFFCTLRKGTLASNTRWSRAQEWLIEIPVKIGDQLLEPILCAHGDPGSPTIPRRAR